MQISNRMTNDPETTSPDETVGAARALMHAGGFRRLPVIDQGKLIGIITDRDVRKYSSDLLGTRVGDAMSSNPITIGPHTTVEQAANLMLLHKIGGLPVVDGGKLIGIVTTTDVLKAFLDIVRATSEILRSG